VKILLSLIIRKINVYLTPAFDKYLYIETRNLYNIDSLLTNVNKMCGHLLEHFENGPFRNCQSWSFITVHGQFYSKRLGLYCQVTIWPRKQERKTPSQAFTRSKQISRIGRSLRFCGTVHWHCCGIWPQHITITCINEAAVSNAMLSRRH